MSDDKPNPAAVMANRAALLQNLGNIFPISEADRSNTIKLQSWYMFALDHVTDFLRASGASGDVILGFTYLTGAIGQLRNGTVGPAASLLQPAPAGGRGPDGVVVWSYRHDVDIGLECILRSKKKGGKQKVAEYIAKEYPILGRLKRDEDDSLPASIVSWRRRFREKDVPESESFQKHRNEFFAQHGGLSPAEMFTLGERCLALAAELTSRAVF